MRSLILPSNITFVSDHHPYESYRIVERTLVDISLEKWTIDGEEGVAIKF